MFSLKKQPELEEEKKTSQKADGAALRKVSFCGLRCPGAVRSDSGYV